tara:strand:+ start:327 stop:575 length:249 start_codon:yes stop_codon:yes gene_type:complete
MPTSIENNSWDYVQGLIEKEVSSSFKTEDERFIGIKEQPICSRYKRKTLKDDEYWSPNPLTMPTKKEIKQLIKKTVIEQRKK